ncbi:MAG TPA: hypothetical protein VJ998_10165 [Pseudomonadales bacterium]|nr:hypothetical protein [Pseudomonadales bacterium]
MIFGRAIEHIRKQHWTGVFIELVIVVLGVFIGLQVQDWNQARQDRALEHQYLERLHEDVGESIEQANRNIAFMKLQIRLESLMVDRLGKCRLEGNDRAMFAGGIALIGELNPTPLARGTIDELRSTGRMGLIRSIQLRREISTVVTAQEHDREILGYVIARVTPHADYVDARAIRHLPDGQWRALYRNIGKDGIPPKFITFDFDALCRDPLYAGAVSSVASLTRTVIIGNQLRLADYRTLEKMLDAALGRSTEPGK